MSTPRSAAGSASPGAAPSMPSPARASTIAFTGRAAMAKAGKGSYAVGFRKPPRSTQFKPGQSGNTAGRPRGAKNFATAFEQELASRVIITENGRRKRVSKREVIAKHLVNKAAGGDLRAIPLLFNETRAREGEAAEVGPNQIFDTPEDRAVLQSMLARIRSSSPGGHTLADSSVAEPAQDDSPPLEDEK